MSTPEPKAETDFRKRLRELFADMDKSSCVKNPTPT